MHRVTVSVRQFSWIALFSVATGTSSGAQDLRFKSALAADTDQAMSALSLQTLAIYKDTARDRRLDNLFRLQMVAGRYAEASKTLRSLRTLRGSHVSLSATATNALYAVLAVARQRSPDAGFEETFRQYFRDSLARLDDKISA